MGSDRRLRICGIAASVAGLLLLSWGYLHTGPAYVYWGSGHPYLDAMTAALSLVVPLLFFVGLTGIHIWCEGRVDRLAESGFVLGMIGSAVGAIRGVENAIGWYDAYVTGYENSTAFGWLVPSWIDWAPILYAGLTVSGIAAVGTKALGILRYLPPTVAAIGWVYYFTDEFGAGGMRLVHIGAGALFGLGWVALGAGLVAASYGRLNARE